MGRWTLTWLVGVAGAWLEFDEAPRTLDESIILPSFHKRPSIGMKETTLVVDDCPGMLQ